MNKSVALAALAATSLLASCGASDADVAPLAVDRLSAEQAKPKASLVSASLAGIADGPAAQRRLGYVNVAALGALDGTISARRVTRLVLGPGAARLADASGSPATATQVGAATVLGGDERVVVGGTSTQRATLANAAPTPNAIEAETPSAVQSCLGDPAAETIVGPAVLGTKSAIGVSLLDTQDAPAGPKLLICVAPHFYRDLHRAQDRLGDLFPKTGLAADRRPVIEEREIGEREIMSAAVALEQVDAALVDELLAGGDRLVAIGAPGPSGGAAADGGPH